MTFQANNMMGPPPKLGPENRALEAWLDMFYRMSLQWFAKERELGDGLGYTSLDVKQVEVTSPILIEADGSVGLADSIPTKGNTIRWIDLGF